MLRYGAARQQGGMCEHRIPLDHARDLLETITAESFGDLGQFGSLGI